MVWQLVEQSRRLTVSLVELGLEQQYEQRAHQLYQLTNDVKRSHSHLLLSMDHWNKFQSSSEPIERWLLETAAQLKQFVAKTECEQKLSQEECMQYWVSYFKHFIYISIFKKSDYLIERFDLRLFII